MAATATKFLGPSLSQLVRPLDVQIMTQSKAIVYYLWLLAIPANLSVIHDFHIAWEPTITVLAAACLLGSVTALALIAWIRHQYAAAYGVLWFLGGLGVTFLMPLHVIISEHRLYLSGAGAALFGLCIVGARPPRGHRVIWTVAIVLLGAMTMNRTAVWQSESSLWSAALRQAPTSSRVRANVGRSHFLAGDLAAAGEVWHAALALDPQNTVILLSLGSLEEDRGNLDLAQAFYRRALTSDPESGPANRQLGMSLARHGETPQALPLLEKAVALDPNAAALTGLAVVRRRLGDLQGARLSLEAALLIDPEHVDALVNLGGLHQEEAMRDRSVPSTGLDAARKIYERVLRMDPAHQEALLNLGELLGYLGEDAAAVETYRQLTTAHPGLVTAHTGLSDALARAGDLPAATRAMEVALGLDSTDASVWAELGGLQARTQQFARAAKALERARQLGDARPQILYNLAEILVVLGQAEWGQGNLDLARHHWTSALSHYRQLPEYRRSGERVTELERRLR